MCPVHDGKEKSKVYRIVTYLRKSPSRALRVFTGFLLHTVESLEEALSQNTVWMIPDQQQQRLISGLHEPHAQHPVEIGNVCTKTLTHAKAIEGRLGNKLLGFHVECRGIIKTLEVVGLKNCFLVSEPLDRKYFSN